MDRPSSSPLFSPAESEFVRRTVAHENRVTPLLQGNSPGTNVKKKPKRSVGDRYDTASYRRAIHRACDKAFAAPEGYTDSQVKQWQSDHRWSPNQLRHAIATQIRATDNMNVEHVAAALGHADLATSQIYAERDERKAIEVAMLIG